MLVVYNSKFIVMFNINIHFVSKNKHFCVFITSTMDDEDEMLYGESDTSVFTSSFTTPAASASSEETQKK